MLNVDGWTDGRTNGRKLARLCLPAKAGATTKSITGSCEARDVSNAQTDISLRHSHML